MQLKSLAKSNKDNILRAYRLVKGDRVRVYEELAKRLDKQRVMAERGRKYMNTKHTRYSKTLNKLDNARVDRDVARVMSGVIGVPIGLTALGFKMKRENDRIREDY